MIYDYCVLGAGLCGALVATKLKSLDKSFCIIDKGRSVGGRLSCKRIGSISFNHGLKYFDCSSENRAWVIGLIDDNLLAKSQPHEILVPANQIVKKILTDIPAQTSEEIFSITQQGTLFFIKSKSGVEWITKKVICTFPAPQALKVLGDSLLAADQINLLRTVDYTKKIICFVETELIKSTSPDYAIEQSGKHSMITFSDQVSEKYFELLDAEIVARLKNDYENLFKLTKSDQINIKKWRYANCKQSIALNYLSNKQKTIFLAGDYLGANKDSSIERTICSAETIVSLLEHR